MFWTRDNIDGLMTTSNVVQTWSYITPSSHVTRLFLHPGNITSLWITRQYTLERINWKRIQQFDTHNSRIINLCTALMGKQIYSNFPSTEYNTPNALRVLLAPWIIHDGLKGSFNEILQSRCREGMA